MFAALMCLVVLFFVLGLGALYILLELDSM
jgi:hypothetical protein